MAAVDKGLDFCGTELSLSEGQDGVIVNEDDGSVHGDTGSEGEDDILCENPQTGQRSRKRVDSPNIQDAEATKHARIPGGRPAINKPVDADFDPDDNRIRELKHQGYNNREVAAKLIEENRIRYVPATVANRWLRMRKVDEKKEDDKLDDELSDWHVGEDDMLEQSFKAVEEKFQREVQKLEDKKWYEVSHALATLLKGKRKYSGKACKERWDSLQDGTALKPIEIDADQKGRKTLRETRIAEAKRRREEEAAEVERAKQAEEDEKEQKKRAKQQRLQDKLDEKLAREADKAEDRRIKEERRAGKAQRKAEKQQAIRNWNAEIEEKKRIRELEERMYRSLTGRVLNRMRRATDKDFIDDDTELDSDEEHDNDADDEDGLDENDENCAVPKAKITLETLKNPRSIMNDEEINILLHERNLPRRGRNETHPHAVARVAAADKKLTRTEIDELLRRHFSGTRGNQAVKTIRLQELDAQKSAAGVKGVKSTDLEFKKGYEGYKGRFSSFIHDEDDEE